MVLSGERLLLKRAERYITNEEKDAFRVESGSVIVYVTSLKEDGNPDHMVRLCEVEKGGIIPAFSYRDIDYIQWRFLFAAKAEAELTVLKDEASKECRKSFIMRTGLSQRERYHDAIVDFYKRERLVMEQLRKEQAEEKLLLRKAENYITNEEKDAFRVESGSVIVYVTSLKEDGNPDHMVRLCEVEKGGIIPAFSYRDIDYTQWRFLFAANAEAELTVLKDEASKECRKSFIMRTGLSQRERYHDAIVDFYKREQLLMAIVGLKELSGEKLLLRNAEYYITNEEKDAFRIESGSVIVYVAPLKEDGHPDQRIRLCEVEKGVIIPAFSYRDIDGTRWRFLFVAGTEAELTILKDGATKELRKNFIKIASLSQKEKYNDAIVDFYKRDGVKDLVFIKATDQINASFGKSSSEVIESVIGGSDEDRLGGNDAMYRVVAQACYAEKIRLPKEEELRRSIGKDADSFSLPAIASASGFAYRDVVLDIDWYKKDCGVLISHIGDQPVCCIPKGQNRYYIYNGTTKKKEVLTEKIAKTVHPAAYSIARTFPEGKVSKSEIFRFAFDSIRKTDLIWVALLALAGALIGILIPTLNQKIYDDYIPLGNYSQLIQLCVVIATFMLGNLFFDIVKKLGEHRISSRVGYDLQKAVYYRLFRLPESFLRKQESADLAQRVSAIPEIAKIYLDFYLISGLGAVFGLLYLYKMFKYAKKLSWFGLVLLLVYAALVYYIATRTRKPGAAIQSEKGRADGKLFQLINGIDKIRMAGAEDRAIYQYLLPFSSIQVQEAKKNRYSALITILSGSAVTMFSMVFYYIIVKKNVQLSIGNFMAFNSAFGSFSAAILKLIDGAISIYQAKPLFNRTMPLFETPEETSTESTVIEELNGAISIRDLHFSYSKDGPTVLNGINMEIKKGEYVGIVGASGCGKSTLLKLLLGFETPTKGQVCYDGKDIKGLNKRALRKKLGVVLQNGQLIAGSIMENITITNAKATMKDVMEAVEAVGLKRDIDNMPMGLHTVLSENSGTISGGQKQRILIARSIINKPSILLMDEATSALDNLTQKQVCDSLDKMHVTRIVIAHRLSTIINCDRIFVLDKGKVVEEGSYDSLMKNENGLFYQLAKRQQIED